MMFKLYFVVSEQSNYKNVRCMFQNKEDGIQHIKDDAAYLAKYSGETTLLEIEFEDQAYIGMSPADIFATAKIVYRLPKEIT